MTRPRLTRYKILAWADRQRAMSPNPIEPDPGAHGEG
jgi:hypothetical protein